MALTDAFIKNTKPSDKPSGDKHTDGQGLYLLVNSVGKYWRMNYRFLGKQKTLALGVYPATSLVKARKARDEARTKLAEGIDPSTAKREARREAIIANNNTFKDISQEWFEKTHNKRAESTQTKLKGWFEHDIWPSIGNRPISQITAPDLLETVVRRLEARKVHHTAHRVVHLCSQVFKYAIVTRRAELDPTLNLRGALDKPIEAHYSAVTKPEQLAPLLRSISGYDGHHSVVNALQILPMVFVRPGELRHAEWSEFDLGKAVWCIPGSKMKMGEDHIVPLAKQALKLFKQLKVITGHGKYVFPSIRSSDKPISDNALNAALRSLGYSGDKHTAHGFRATFRTIADEVLGERVDLIEHQLAHAVKDANGRAYNRTSHLPARTDMMQRWADYLEDLAKT
jgi:integrase